MTGAPERELHARLAPVERRQRRQKLLRAVARGMLLGSAIAVALAALRWWLPTPVVAGLVVASVVAGGLLGAIVAVRTPRDLRAAAVAVDAHYGLQDRAVTALAFVGKAAPSPLEQMQVADTLVRVAQIDAQQVVPARFPKRFLGAAVPVAAAVAALAWPAPMSPDGAEPKNVASQPSTPAPSAPEGKTMQPVPRPAPDPGAAEWLRAEIQWQVVPQDNVVLAPLKTPDRPTLDQLAVDLAEEAADRDEQPSSEADQAPEIVLRSEPPSLEHRRAVRRYFQSIGPLKDADRSSKPEKVDPE